MNEQNAINIKPTIVFCVAKITNNHIQQALDDTCSSFGLRQIGRIRLLQLLPIHQFVSGAGKEGLRPRLSGRLLVDEGRQVAGAVARL